MAPVPHIQLQGYDLSDICRQGRVLQANGQEPELGVYVVGWAKRGPTGIIGSPLPCRTPPCNLLCAGSSAKHLADQNEVL